MRRTVELRRSGGSIWRGFVAGVGPGQLYGYRVAGPFKPAAGLWHNPAKVLLDPWALAMTRMPKASPSERSALHGFAPGRSPRRSVDGRDTAGVMPKCVVVKSQGFDWQGTSRPQTPWRDTVIYEAHVKGSSQRHPDVPTDRQGTYLGLVEPPILDHLQRLGVTAVELLPVFHHLPEAHLIADGRSNYWGYAPVGFLAPHAGYATGDQGQQVDDFKTMVRELHRVGIEVILDVVFNHTPEGGDRGLVYGPRGLDAGAYYRLDRRGRFVDWTGTGNTLDARSPVVRQLILGSLRYWVETMQVDGFRFDLATTLMRDGSEDGERLLRAIAQDPVLATCKLIAEPWDLGPDGYRLGRFPSPWSQWNDRFRDAARRFWTQQDGSAEASNELGRRLAGSSDLLSPPERSIHYVTSHDGFTLADLVSYNHKHNEANGEDNRDGTNHNTSRNHGVEGPSDDPAIVAARQRARRGLLTTLLLSRGVPMLAHGDEIGRTQGGNNNAYCQDNAVSWLDWQQVDQRLLDFCRRLVAVRHRHATAIGEGNLSWRAESDDGAALVGTVAGQAESLMIVMNGSDSARVVQISKEWIGHPIVIDTRLGEAPVETTLVDTEALELPGKTVVVIERLSNRSLEEIETA